MSRRIQFESSRAARQGEPASAGTLAIVGRPNVGKSTLFNRLVGSRRAIVGDEPGITRDRLYGDVEWTGRKLRVVDTGGIIPDDQQLIPAEIFRQARVALEEADVIVMVVDGRTELASPDIDLARLLLRTGKPLLLAVNKADTPQLEPYAEEFRRLGIKELFPISAENGNGIAELLDHVFEVMPEREAPIEEEVSHQPELESDHEEEEPEIAAGDEGRDHRPPERRQVDPAECADWDLARHRLAGRRNHARRGGRIGRARRTRVPLHRHRRNSPQRKNRIDGREAFGGDGAQAPRSR